MKAFHFRLQTKLNICQRQEQAVREEMQRKIVIRNQLLQELQKLETRFLSVQESIREINTRPGQFPRMVVIRRYMPVIKEQIEENERKLAIAEAQAEEVRLVLMDRMRETRTLEKLKDKVWHRYLHELLLEEQKQIDELAGTAHHRKSL